MAGQKGRKAQGSGHGRGWQGRVANNTPNTSKCVPRLPTGVPRNKLWVTGSLTMKRTKNVQKGFGAVKFCKSLVY